MPAFRLDAAIALKTLALVLASVLALPGAARAAWSWDQAAPLPSLRTEVSAASDGTFIYVLGGFGENRNAPTEVYRFDPSAGWSVIANLPEGVNHTGLIATDGKLYVIGGYRAATFDVVSNVRVLDLATFAWSEGAPMPGARGALAVALFDGKIHALGGTAGRPDSVATHEVYDPATDEWRSLAPFVMPRNHLTAASFGDEIFIFGGRDRSTFRIRESEAYNPATDTWRTISPMPTGRSGIASAVLGGRIVVFGGESTDLINRTFDETEAYDPATDTWETLPPMPIARHGLGAATLGNAIHVISGGPQPGFTFSDVHHVLTYTPERPGESSIIDERTIMSGM